MDAQVPKSGVPGRQPFVRVREGKISTTYQPVYYELHDGKEVQRTVPGPFDPRDYFSQEEGEEIAEAWERAHIIARRKALESAIGAAISYHKGQANAGKWEALRRKITFREFAETRYFPEYSAFVIPKTIRRYKYCLRRFAYPMFGNTEMQDIRVIDLNNYYESLLVDEQTTIHVVKQLRAAVNSLMRCAKQQEFTTNWIPDNHELKIPIAQRRDRRARRRLALHPQAFWEIHAALPTAGAKLLIELMADTGARPSQIYPLAPCDFEYGIVWLDRSASYQPPADGAERIWVREFNKTDSDHWVPVHPDLYKRIQVWIEENNLDAEDPIFPYRLVSPHFRPYYTEEDLATLPKVTVERKIPNSDKTRTIVLQHGTVQCYHGLPCHCEPCTRAASMYNNEMRAARRLANGEGPSSRRPIQPNDPMANHNFYAIWNQAVIDSSVNTRAETTLKAVRTMNASWLKNQGVSIWDIQAGVGHTRGSKVTERHYLRPVAVEDAMEKFAGYGEVVDIQKRRRGGSEPASPSSGREDFPSDAHRGSSLA